MKTYFGLPEKVVFCSKCVISNQRPRSTVEFMSLSTDHKETIQFSDDQICEACKFQSMKEKIDWTAREQQLLRLCDKYRKKSGYDVVIPGSGGKDSAFTAHILKYKYGMNPLTVTWAPHLYTNIGWENFINWIHVGGFDNILFTPNGDLHRYLTREAFINLLHPFQPFIVGQRMIGAVFAKKYGIDLVMYGENQAEYGNSIDENNTPLMQKKFYKNVSPTEINLGGKSINTLISESKFSFKDFEPYLPISESEESQFIDVHYLGYYLKWDPQECFYYAVENTGFKTNPDRTEGSYSKYSSLDDKIDPFHYYTTYIKFGLGRASYDAAQEIRNGKISREEGVSLVKQFDNEFPAKYFADFLNYIDLDQGSFETVIDRFRSPHLWKQTIKDWKLLHTVWNA